MLYNKLTPKFILRKVTSIMAKFCTNCGTALNDDATVCTSCGFAVPTAAPQATPTPEAKNVEQKFAEIGKKITGALDSVASGEAFKDMTPEKKQKYLKFGIIGAAGVVALIILIIIISLIDQFIQKSLCRSRCICTCKISCFCINHFKQFAIC